MIVRFCSNVVSGVMKALMGLMGMKPSIEMILRPEFDYVFWCVDVWVATKSKFRSHGLNSQQLADKLRELMPSAIVTRHYQVGDNTFVEFVQRQETLSI